MKEGIFFIAVDVDDNLFHGCGINSQTGEIREFSCRPTVGHLEKKLAGFKQGGTELRVCYEATYLGFSLCRDLEKRGYACEVIAPSLIPELAGKRMKTDRIDARKLAGYYMHGQLTKVHIPSVAEELVRDIIRSRKFITEQCRALKLHILSICRRVGIHYREGEAREKKHYWTSEHRAWLQAKIQERPDLKFNLTLLLNCLDQWEMQVKSYEVEIRRVSELECYRGKVKALCCYRGVDVLTAMTFITELGDIHRFKHPRQLCSYAGMDLQEYSSGGHEHRYRMSKMGNVQLRTGAIESCQGARQLPRISKSLKARRKGVDSKYVEIADRCMKRLYQKSKHLLAREKMANKVKVACARELLCFVWESLKAAA